MSKRVGVALAATAAAAVLATSCVVEVDDLGGETSRAKAMNASGIVVGTSDVPVGSGPTSLGPSAFKRNADGTIVDLPELSGDVESEVFDINDAGTIVGLSRASNGTTRAVTWNASGQVTQVATDYDDARATAIDSSGVIVGESAEGPWVYHPGAGVQSLGDLEGFLWTSVTGMNDVGDAVGYTSDITGSHRALMWDLDTRVVSDITQWAGLSRAQDINDNRLVVGIAPGSRPAAWGAPGGPTIIGEGHGEAYAITDDAMVVGSIENSAGTYVAFRWTATTGLHLESEEWSRALGVGPNGASVGEHDNHAALFYPDEEE